MLQNFAAKTEHVKMPRRRGAVVIASASGPQKI
jgi:hypothetical protein